MDAIFEVPRKEAQQKPSHLFLLRVWSDEKSGQEKWEGKIQHVHTGETLTFTDWASLSALLESMLDEDEASKAKQQKTPASEPGGTHWYGRES